MAKNTWASNFGKSVKFGLINAAEGLTPGISSMFERNEQYFTNIVDTLRELKTGQTRVNSAIARTSPELAQTLSDIMNAGKTFGKNAQHFIKTGDIQGPHQMPGADVEASIGDMKDLNLDDVKSDAFEKVDDELFNFDDLPSPEEAMASGRDAGADATLAGAKATVAATKAGAEATVAGAKVVSANLVRVNNNISAGNALVAKGFEGTTKSLNANFRLMNSLFEKSITETNATLKMVNDNLSNLVNFNNDTHLKHAMAAMKYYDDSLTELRSISQSLQRAYPEKKEQEKVKSDYERTLGYGFDMGEYADVVKKNFLNTEVGGALKQVLGPEFLSMIATEGPGMILGYAIGSVIPQVLKSATAEFDKTVTAFIPALLGKLGSFADDMTASPIMQQIGQIFGIRPSGAQLSLGNYEKGPVPFDGITHKTINQVIPTYLSKILAAITNSEEMHFDHESGTFRSMADIRRENEAHVNRMVDASFGDLGSRIDNAASDLGIVFQNKEMENLFKEYAKEFKRQAAFSGRHLNWNNESQMDELFDLVRMASPAFSNPELQSNLPGWKNLILGAIRNSKKYDQLQGSMAAYEFTNQYQKNIDQARISGNNRYALANSGFTDIDSAAMVDAANRRAAEAGYGTTNYNLVAQGVGTGKRRKNQGPTTITGTSTRGDNRYSAGYVSDLAERQAKLDRILDTDLSSYSDEFLQAEQNGELTSDDIRLYGLSYNDLVEIKKRRMEELQEQANINDIFDKNKPRSIDQMMRDNDSFDEDDYVDPETRRKREYDRKSFGGKLKHSLMDKPAEVIASALGTVNEIMYRMIFGSDGEKGALEYIVEQVQVTFNGFRDWLVKDVFRPLKEYFFGDDFRESKFYKSVSGFFNNIIDAFKGKKDANGNYSGGVASDMMNSFSDIGRSVSNMVTGREQTLSDGTKLGVNNDSLFGAAASMGRTFSTALKDRYLGEGDEDREKRERLEKATSGLMDRLNNRAVGGGIPVTGPYLLSSGETVYGHYATGTPLVGRLKARISKTGIYKLDAGDTVKPAGSGSPSDIEKSQASEANFTFKVLKNIYGDTTDYLKGIYENIVNRIAPNTDTIAAGTAEGVGGKGSKGSLGQIDSLIKSIVGNTDEIQNNKRKPLIDVIFDKVANSVNQFAAALGGSSRFDNKYVQQEFAAAIRKKAPSAVSKGLVGGAAFSGLNAFGAFGALGSLFSPIGGIMLGLGVSMLHHNESFLDMMYGKKDEAGNRQGGIVPKSVQTFIKKNQTAILGGAALGGLKAITGLGITSFLPSTGVLGGIGSAIGFLPMTGLGLVGPVFATTAMSVALKSNKMQTLLFGTGDPEDGKKATGILNGEMSKRIKHFLPNAIVGGLGGYAGFAGLNSALGLAGVAFQPWLGALLGGAVGIGMASDRFRDALFGKYDEKEGRFVSGGLVDSVKNFLRVELLTPAVNFGREMLNRSRHFIEKDIMYPFAKAFQPYKALAGQIFTNMKESISNFLTETKNWTGRVFKWITAPFRKLATVLFDAGRHAAASAIRLTAGAAGALVSAPIKLLSALAPGSFKDPEYQEAIERGKQRAEEFRAKSDARYEESKAVIKADVEENDQLRRMYRATGYADTEEQLMAKTQAHHEEAERIKQAELKAKEDQAARDANAREQTELLRGILDRMGLFVDSLDANGRYRLVDANGNIVHNTLNPDKQPIGSNVRDVTKSTGSTDYFESSTSSKTETLTSSNDKYTPIEEAPTATTDSDVFEAETPNKRRNPIDLIKRSYQNIKDKLDRREKALDDKEKDLELKEKTLGQTASGGLSDLLPVKPEKLGKTSDGKPSTVHNQLEALDNTESEALEEQKTSNEKVIDTLEKIDNHNSAVSKMRQAFFGKIGGFIGEQVLDFATDKLKEMFGRQFGKCTLCDVVEAIRGDTGQSVHKESVVDRLNAIIGVLDTGGKKKSSDPEDGTPNHIDEDHEKEVRDFGKNDSKAYFERAKDKLKALYQNNVLKYLKDIAQNSKEANKGKNSIVDFLKDKFMKLLPLLAALPMLFDKGFDLIKNAISDKIGELGTKFENFLSGLPAKVVEAWEILKKKGQQVVEDGVNKAKEKVSRGVEYAKHGIETAKKYGAKAVEVGKKGIDLIRSTQTGAKVLDAVEGAKDKVVDVVQRGATKAEEVIGKFKELCGKLFDYIKNSAIVRKALGEEGVPKLIDTLKSVLTKPKLLLKFLPKIAGVVAKLAGMVILGPIATVAIATYETYRGVTEAAEIFGVSPEDVTPGMRLVAAAYNNIMVYSGFGIVVDLILEMIQYGTDEALEPKRFLVSLLYNLATFGTGATELKQKQDKLSKELEGKNEWRRGAGWSEMTKSEYIKYKKAEEEQKNPSLLTKTKTKLWEATDYAADKFNELKEGVKNSDVGKTVGKWGDAVSNIINNTILGKPAIDSETGEEIAPGNENALLPRFYKWTDELAAMVPTPKGIATWLFGERFVGDVSKTLDNDVPFPAKVMGFISGYAFGNDPSVEGYDSRFPTVKKEESGIYSTIVGLNGIWERLKAGWERVKQDTYDWVTGGDESSPYKGKSVLRRGLEGISNNLEWIAKSADNEIRFVRDKITETGKDIRAWWEGPPTFGERCVESLKDARDWFTGGEKDGPYKGKCFLRRGLETVLDTINAALKKVMPKISNEIDYLVNGFVDFFKSAGKAISGAVNDLSSIVAHPIDFVTSLFGTLTDLAMGKYKQCTAAWSTAFEDVKKKNGGGSGWMPLVPGGYGGAGYKQNIGAWANKPVKAGHPELGTNKDGGCGIAGLMNNAQAAGIPMSSRDAQSAISSNNIARDGSGLTGQFFKDAASKSGNSFNTLSTEGSSDMERALGSGRNLVAGVQTGGGGHYVNLSGLIKRGGKAYTMVDDPAGGSAWMPTKTLSGLVNGPRSPRVLGYMSKGRGVGGRGGWLYGGFGNRLYMPQQSTAKNCTLTATAALLNAYKGTNYTSSNFDFSGPNWWYQELKSLPAEEKIFGPGDGGAFVNYLESNFGANPEHPMLLYQVGGDGSNGNHPLNRGGGAHATVVGRRLADGTYEVYDSNGGMIHKLNAGQIFDSSARGSSQGYNAGEGNILFNPQIQPSSKIDSWTATGKVSDETSSAPNSAATSVSSGSNRSGMGLFSKLSSAFAGIFGQAAEMALTGNVHEIDVNALMNSGSSSSGGNSGYKDNTKYTDTGEVEKNVWDYLVTNGYTKEAAAGILGPWKNESNIQPKRVEADYLDDFPGYDAIENDRNVRNAWAETINKRTAGGVNLSAYRGDDGSYYPGMGLAQWTGPRGQALIEFARSNGGHWYDIGTQIRFFNQEMEQGHRITKDELNSAGSVDKATDLFTRYYEGNTVSSYFPPRRAAANEIYQKYKDRIPGGAGGMLIPSNIHGGGAIPLVAAAAGYAGRRLAVAALEWVVRRTLGEAAVASVERWLGTVGIPWLAEFSTLDGMPVADRWNAAVSTAYSAIDAFTEWYYSNGGGSKPLIKGYGGHGFGGLVSMMDNGGMGADTGDIIDPLKMIRHEHMAFRSSVPMAGGSEATSMLNILKSISIKSEAKMMLEYLKRIAENTLKGPTITIPGGSSSTPLVGNNSSSGMSAPSYPPTTSKAEFEASQRATNPAGKNGIGAMHAKNLQIARGGNFRNS